MAVVDSAGVTAVVRVRRRVGLREADPTTRDLALVGLVALPFAVRYPVATSIGSLVAFGLAHTFLELRWVLARFRAVLRGPFLAAVCVPATVIALSRLMGGPKELEIVAGFGLVAVALTRLKPVPAALAAVALALGLVVSLRTPGMYGVVLAHLHNTVTGVLLWEWSGDWAERRRRRFRAGLAVLFAALPALLLLGAADAFLPSTLAATHGPAHMLVGGVTPPGWATSTLGIRLVAAFAFLQVVHYGVWCWLLPRPQGVTTSTASSGGWIAAGIVATAVLALVFRTDYATGRTLYGSLATYHAYLEFPVVLVLLGGSRVPR